MKSLFLLLLALSSSALLAQNSGKISGTVTDKTGKPVPRAKVFATSSGSEQSLEKMSVSDAQGNFSFANLPYATYSVGAELPEKGFPDTTSPFYSDNAAHTLTLNDKSPSTSVSVRFGERASSIQGTVLDDVNKQPIPITILLRRADDTSNFYTVAQPSDYRVLLPPNVKILMEITSPGYKTWYYPGTTDPAARKPIVMKRLQTIKLNVNMARDFLNCACNDRPQHWGLGSDSPEFQMQSNNGFTQESLRCNKAPTTGMP